MAEVCCVFFLCFGYVVVKEVNRRSSGDDVIGSLVIIYSLLLSRPELEGVFFFWYRVTYIPSLFFVILICDAPWWFFLFFFFFLSILNAIKNQMICYFFPITMFHMNTWWKKYCISFCQIINLYLLCIVHMKCTFAEQKVSIKDYWNTKKTTEKSYNFM